MTLTGKCHDEAQGFVNELLVSFGGEPGVTSSGTLFYRFPELTKTFAHKLSADALVPLYPHGEESTITPSEDRKKQSGIINIVNGANLLFGLYYSLEAIKRMRGLSSVAHTGHNASPSLFQGVHAFMVTAQVAHTLPTILFGFGILPLGIAATYFTLHLLAERHDGASRKALWEEHLRKRVYFHVMCNPRSVDPTEIRLGGASGRLSGGAEAFVARTLDELASTFYAEIEDLGDGHYIYHFPEIDREIRDLDTLRSSIDDSAFDLGRIVYDTRTRAE